ncbi:MAG: hypothetical protein L6Q71_06095 [Planctomycetes bacterium]|nr:hypothetical protein [Planctomycetota bacterium]NUQ35734.1 hypothetical protein [Planctomycetaceae bacterium]
MGRYTIYGFIKYKNEIGLYRADSDAWILDMKGFCEAHGQDLSKYTGRPDKRFAKNLLCPVRKDDIQALVDWFDANATIQPADIIAKLEKMDYAKLHDEYEEHLPAILYDFDEREAFENPDLNPYIPYDDYLPEGWKNIVVEGFDALVPGELIYWQQADATLNRREEKF